MGLAGMWVTYIRALSVIITTANGTIEQMSSLMQYGSVCHCETCILGAEIGTRLRSRGRNLGWRNRYILSRVVWLNKRASNWMIRFIAPYILKPKNYRKLERYRWFTHFAVRGCTRIRVLKSSLVVSLQRIYNSLTVTSSHIWSP
jgi:hypothetical protein